MRLRCDETGSGRPEQVVYALGFNEYPKSIQRTKLVLGATQMKKVPGANNRITNSPFPRS
jgi:hypothetical protein